MSKASGKPIIVASEGTYVFPHHAWIVFNPIAPFFGNCKLMIYVVSTIVIIAKKKI